jgi:hypothetical protein
MRLSTCPECDRLWREFSATTFEHLKLQNELALAALERDTSAIDRLTPATEMAAIARNAARESIRQHEAKYQY